MSVEQAFTKWREIEGLEVLDKSEAHEKYHRNTLVAPRVLRWYFSWASDLSRTSSPSISRHLVNACSTDIVSFYQVFRQNSIFWLFKTIGGDNYCPVLQPPATTPNVT